MRAASCSLRQLVAPICQSIRVPVTQSLTLRHVSTATLSSSPDCGENATNGEWVWEFEIVSSTDPSIVASRRYQNDAYPNDEPDFAVVTVCAEPAHAQMW